MKQAISHNDPPAADMKTSGRPVHQIEMRIAELSQLFNAMDADNFSLPRYQCSEVNRKLGIGVLAGQSFFYQCPPTLMGKRRSFVGRSLTGEFRERSRWLPYHVTQAAPFETIARRQC